MKKIVVDFENCFGIKKLKHEFKFESNKVNSVYAKNGVMKTSFTKVFDCIKNSKTSQIKDQIFGESPSKYDVYLDDNLIKDDEIFVIHSYRDKYETSNLGDLLIDTELKEEVSKLLIKRNELLKKIENLSGIKVSRTTGGKVRFELEPKIIKDMDFHEDSILMNLNYFIEKDEFEDYSKISYSAIFSDTAYKKIISDDFQNLIEKYLLKSDEIYGEYHFFEKGKFHLGKLKKMNKDIKNSSFFVKDNALKLNGNTEINSEKDLSQMIKEIEGKIYTSPEYKKIESLLSDATGTILKDLIESHPELIRELKKNSIENLRQKLWISYFKAFESEVIDLYKLYEEVDEKVKSLRIDDTPWKNALDIFESRFDVPYRMKIENIRSSVIGESIPRVKFSFCKDGDYNNDSKSNWIDIDRDQLEAANVLSQGEKRALYLLNIIFDIEKLKRDNKNVLVIVDDIADSFDYKNKYAIVEYLKEISELEMFKMIILSHNFDFYRTISSRLNLSRENRFLAVKTENGIEIEKELYQKNPFEFWKKSTEIKHFIALIPFVRNLIEYGVDKEINNFIEIDRDFMLCTHLLHFKKHTELITVGHLKEVFKEYIGKKTFNSHIDDSEYVSGLIINVANQVKHVNNKLEDKVILAIAIRLVSEKIMIESLKSSTKKITWELKRNQKKIGGTMEFLTYLESAPNQTRELVSAYMQLDNVEHIGLLSKVNIMTPELIHINSFMYEPILDMDINELINLYQSLKHVEKNCASIV